MGQAKIYWDMEHYSMVEKIFRHLAAAYHDGGDMEARGAMLLGSFEAGVAFTRASVGYVHAIAHQLGAMFHTPHGDANAMLLPHVAKLKKAVAMGMISQSDYAIIKETLEGKKKAAAKKPAEKKAGGGGAGGAGAAGAGGMNPMIMGVIAKFKALPSKKAKAAMVEKNKAMLLPHLSKLKGAVAGGMLSQSDYDIIKETLAGKKKAGAAKGAEKKAGAGKAAEKKAGAGAKAAEKKAGAAGGKAAGGGA